MAEPKAEKKVILLPEGMLINSALFERDSYAPEGGAASKPKYKIEVAIDPKLVTGEGTIEDDLADAIEAKWGAAAADDFLNGKPGFVDPRIDGNRLADAREERGKEGGAYRNKMVIRADSVYNLHGLEAPGGASVYGPDTKPIGAANQGEIYPGCYGIVAVTIHTYEADSRGPRGEIVKLKGLKFYLSAFQKTRDGEKLMKSQDKSTLFKPVTPAAANADQSGVRRRRAG